MGISQTSPSTCFTACLFSFWKISSIIFNGISPAATCGHCSCAACRWWVWLRYLHAAQGAIGHHHSQAHCWLMVSTLSTRTPVLCSVSSVLRTNMPMMHLPYQPGCWSRLALVLSPEECHLLMPIESRVVDHYCLLTSIAQTCAFSSRAVVCPSSPYCSFAKCGRQCYWLC